MSAAGISDADVLFLRAAVELAEAGLYSCTPNPRVGCLLVRDGRILGRGAHLRAGEGHAEVNALADAARSTGSGRAGADVSGATAYVSLEPCVHTGRTPPCTEALIAANVRRVVTAMGDPNPQVAGRGFERLEGAGIRTQLVPLQEAAELNAGFVSRVTRGRPLVRIKVAASLDGRTAMASGESRWITGTAARADVQYWRARSCAVITGSGTVLADDPQLTVRDARYAVQGQVRQPLRVVTDTALQVAPEAALFAAEGPILLVHGDGRLPRVPGVEHLACGTDRVDLARLLDILGARGCNEVLVEAGPRLVGAFLAEGLWDELLVYLAPKLLGSDARAMAWLPLVDLDQAVGATIRDCVELGGDLRVRLVPAARSESSES